jgi:hypothetical protein
MWCGEKQPEQSQVLAKVGVMSSLIILGEKNVPRLINSSPPFIGKYLIIVPVLKWKKRFMPDPGRDGVGAGQNDRVHMAGSESSWCLCPSELSAAATEHCPLPPAGPSSSVPCLLKTGAVSS